MRKDSKANTVWKVMTTMVALVVMAVALPDFIKIPHGSLAESILIGLNRGIFRKYVGFAGLDMSFKASLLPLCVLSVLVALNAWFRKSIIYSICDFLAFVSAYIMFGSAGNGSDWYWMSRLPAQANVCAAAVFLVSVTAIALKIVHGIRRVRIAKRGASEVRKAQVRKVMPADFETTRSDGSKAESSETVEEADVEEVTGTKAAIRELLRATEPPKFDAFRETPMPEPEPIPDPSGLNIIHEAVPPHADVFGLDAFRRRLAEARGFDDRFAMRSSYSQIDAAYDNPYFRPQPVVQQPYVVVPPVVQQSAPQPIIINLNGNLGGGQPTVQTVQPTVQQPQVATPQPTQAAPAQPAPAYQTPTQAAAQPAPVQEPVQQASAQPEVEDDAQPQPVRPTPRPQEQQPSLDYSDDFDDIRGGTPQKGKTKSQINDIDTVSGVGGLSSSYTGDSYLIDRQKFEWHFPPEGILKHYEPAAEVAEDIENDPNGQIIVETLLEFKVPTTLTSIHRGPTFTLYELTLGKGVRINAVSNCTNELNMNLALKTGGVRIMAPIPGKPSVGVEVPNAKRDTIGFDVMVQAIRDKNRKIPMALGNTISGESIVIDLASTPHLLVAGSTGSGKSVCINALLASVLYNKSPKEVRMILIDPKKVEMSIYNDIPHLLTPVITEGKRVLKALSFLCDEMDRRMRLCEIIGARNIVEYNEKITKQGLARVKFPYIMLVIDEFADLMLSNIGKEMEMYIKRLAILSRAAGIHMVLATQRPTSELLNGTIKTNIPEMIAFAVRSGQDSRNILDENGAEALLGKGDMLYKGQSQRDPQRIQGCFITSEEIDQIVSFVKAQATPDYIDEAFFEDDEPDDDEDVGDEDDGSSSGEDLFTKSWKVVSERGEASVGYLQRKFKIGFNRASNIIDQLEEAGYIGPKGHGSKAREVLKYYGTDTNEGQE